MAGERTQWRYASECPRLPPDPQIRAMLFLVRDFCLTNLLVIFLESDFGLIRELCIIFKDKQVGLV